MAKVIIYPYHAGNVAVIVPSGLIPLEEVARKDVPAGLPYFILDEEELPQDYEFFDAWETDFTNPDGYGIGADAWFAEQATKNNTEVSE
jgi:hypothetical protein